MHSNAFICYHNNTSIVRTNFTRTLTIKSESNSRIITKQLCTYNWLPMYIHISYPSSSNSFLIQTFIDYLCILKSKVNVNRNRFHDCAMNFSALLSCKRTKCLSNVTRLIKHLMLYDFVKLMYFSSSCHFL